MDNLLNDRGFLANITETLSDFTECLPPEKREALSLTVAALCLNCAAKGLKGSNVYRGLPIHVKQQLADDLTRLIEADGAALTAVLRGGHHGEE